MKTITIATSRAVGRPSAYRVAFCARVVALMAEGRSLDGCAALLGVHPDSLYTWQKIHPEFSEAVRAGRAAATTFWEDRLLDIARGGPGNAQAIQWALRNRSRAASGWHSEAARVDPDPETETPPRTSLDFSSLSRDERTALRDALEKVRSLTTKARLSPPRRPREERYAAARLAAPTAREED